MQICGAIETVSERQTDYLPDPRIERLFGDGADAFRMAIDLLPDPVGIVWAIRDRSGAIVDLEAGYSNPATARMIGVPLQDSFGRRFLEVPENAQDEMYQRLCRVIETGRPEAVEITVPHGRGPEGRVRGTFLHRVIPLGADGALSLAIDVTEQRRMEEELRNYAKVVAHDLRQPIMAAGYFTELLARRLDDGRTAENEDLLDKVRQTHTGARGLIDGVLDYASSGYEPGRRPGRHRGADGGCRRGTGRHRRSAQRTARDLTAADRARRPRSAPARVPEPRGQRPQVPCRRASAGCGLGRAQRCGVASAARSSRRTVGRSGPSPPTAPARWCASRCRLCSDPADHHRKDAWRLTRAPV
jgi:signal transduction histidine kinase